jgi:hypothetical protein
MAIPIVTRASPVLTSAERVKSGDGKAGAAHGEVTPERPCPGERDEMLVARGVSADLRDEFQGRRLEPHQKLADLRHALPRAVWNEVAVLMAKSKARSGRRYRESG